MVPETIVTIISSMTTRTSDHSPIKIVLIDDHFLIHESVAHQLEGHSDLALVAAGTAGEQIEPLIRQYQPQVVVLDLGIPPRIGVSICQAGR